MEEELLSGFDEGLLLPRGGEGVAHLFGKGKWCLGAVDKEMGGGRATVLNEVGWLLV